MRVLIPLVMALVIGGVASTQSTPHPGLVPPSADAASGEVMPAPEKASKAEEPRAAAAGEKRAGTPAAPSVKVWFEDKGLRLGFERLPADQPVQLVQAFTRCETPRAFNLRARFTLTRDDGKSLERSHEKKVKAHWCKAGDPEVSMVVVPLEPGPGRWGVKAEMDFSPDGKAWTSVGARETSFVVGEAPTGSDR